MGGTPRAAQLMATTRARPSHVHSVGGQRPPMPPTPRALVVRCRSPTSHDRRSCDVRRPESHRIRRRVPNPAAPAWSTASPPYGERRTRPPLTSGTGMCGPRVCGRRVCCRRVGWQWHHLPGCRQVRRPVSRCPVSRCTSIRSVAASGRRVRRRSDRGTARSPVRASTPGHVRRSSPTAYTWGRDHGSFAGRSAAGWCGPMSPPRSQPPRWRRRRHFRRHRWRHRHRHRWRHLRRHRWRHRRRPLPRARRPRSPTSGPLAAAARVARVGELVQLDVPRPPAGLVGRGGPLSDLGPIDLVTSAESGRAAASGLVTVDTSPGHVARHSPVVRRRHRPGQRVARRPERSRPRSRRSTRPVRRVEPLPPAASRVHCAG